MDRLPWGDQNRDIYITHTGFDYTNGSLSTGGQQDSSKQRILQQDDLVTDYEYVAIHRLTNAVTRE